MTWDEIAKTSSGVVAVLAGMLLTADRVRGWWKDRGTSQPLATSSTSSARPQRWLERRQRIAPDGTRPDPPETHEVTRWEPDA